MNVILTPVGSAGDVNPFIIIGRELRRRGHRVTLLGPAIFANLASKSALGFIPIASAKDYEDTTANPDLWHPRRGPRLVFKALGDQLRRSYAAVESVFEPNRTLLVGHSLSFFTRTFEDVHPVAAATVHLAPSVFRSDFVQSALPSGQDISAWPRWAKRILWWLVDRFAIDPLIAPTLNAWRREVGASPVARVFKNWLHSPQCVIGLFPAWFAQPQPDWPSPLHLAGFVLSDAACTPTSTTVAGATADHEGESLDEFLASGEAPIVFTPGSANQHAADFFRAGIEASAAIGRRALLVTPFREQLPSALPPSARHVSYASFASLFPRAAAVVHHGGIGTCAQGLAAGVPQLVMPMGFDQPDNALRLTRLGVANTIAPRRFIASTVSAALGNLLSGRAVADACLRWRDRVLSEPAVNNVCDLLEQRYDRFHRGVSSA